MKILVVEDQKKLQKFVEKGLQELGYAVDVADSGSGAEVMVSENDYDLVVLDVMLPGANGFDTARHLRRDGYQKPILMLTALNTTKDKVNGLDAGADDYLTKPFEFDELAARVRALLRRNSGQTSSVLNFEDLEMDLLHRRVKRGTQEITLTVKEFSLLELFLRNPDRPLSRTTIQEKVWDSHFDTDSNVVDVYVNMLRKKIDQPFPTKLIQTIVGVGYALRKP